MTAKAVEDCHFYRDARLVALNEVGGEPQRFGVSAAEFHRANMIRARLWPHTMTTLSTHDTKRGEDVRARIGVLSQVPGLWAEFVGRWEAAHPSPDLPTGLFLWQNIFGVWPANGRITTGLRERPAVPPRGPLVPALLTPERTQRRARQRRQPVAATDQHSQIGRGAAVAPLAARRHGAPPELLRGSRRRQRPPSRIGAEGDVGQCARHHSRNHPEMRATIKSLWSPRYGRVSTPDV
jgi:hypothetical protein